MTVINDLHILEIKYGFEEIRKMKKEHFMTIIKDKIRPKAFTDMEDIKGSHSKVNNLYHENIQMQKYLKPNKCKMNKEDG